MMAFNKKETLKDNVPAKILVVDDERPIRELLKQILVKEGYEVVTVPDGHAAVAKAKAGDRPNLALLDMRMPGIDGIETMKQLKAICPELDMVMITGYGTKKLALQAMKLGAYDYLEKPFNIQRVRDIIRKCFELRDLNREVAELRKSVARKKNGKGI